ncbi:16S rRNA (cytosine(967)-C(5))-methyltransferase protein [Dioscorea alata]|uniref:16S rRNA (Cytosine(967)-C(5))-methyltransferase protein n=1 Tax=Dioscorea alata TaxID=55571 RepID=A0ACB7VVI8_DIOAL|nr:16S rRNA (cytosine(967)-C(5))-methyltransferase protein [Dioscorea alata]
MADSTPEQSSTPPLPRAFLDFLEENGIDPSIYVKGDAIPRYIRLKPGCENLVPEIETELGCELERVDWLPGFYAVPPHIKIASSEAYKSGKIYGMDAASGAAVLALDVSEGDHVLDLCAAPGAKLCMLSDLLGNSGSLTGVDVSRDRLAACRTMLRKYTLGDHCRLFIADGTSFSLLPLRPSVNVKSCVINGAGVASIFGEWTSKRSYKDRKNAVKLKNSIGSQLALVTSEPELFFYGKNSGVVGLQRSELFFVADNAEASNFGYDKVLVDAECTHDGSVKHIQKFEYWGWKTLDHRVLDAKRTNSLLHLQLQLLTNGFRLLKAGGTLVYSTCSLTFAQNEDVVEQFLKENHSAELQGVDAAKNWPCRSGRIPHTLRFDPNTSQTSGLFVAKFIKIHSKNAKEMNQLEKFTCIA